MVSKMVSQQDCHIDIHEARLANIYISETRAADRHA